MTHQVIRAEMDFAHLNVFTSSSAPKCVFFIVISFELFLHSAAEGGKFFSQTVDKDGCSKV